jgi:hypothetical protein
VSGVDARRFRCLGFEWSIRTNDAALVDRVTSLYEACVDETSGPARSVFDLRRHEDASVSVDRNGGAGIERVPESVALARVVWEVNRGVVEEAGDRLLLHAAAAERDGRIVVLAGPQGSGKSTLVTALVCAGFRYVTDETVAIEPGGTIEPYPKPISLRDDSLAALRDLCPRLPRAAAPSAEELVPAQNIRRDAIAPRGGVANVLALLSTFEPGRSTAVRPIPRAEAAVALGEQSFNLRAFGPGGLGVVAEMVRRCDCYRLDVGDVDATRKLLSELVDNVSSDR